MFDDCGRCEDDAAPVRVRPPSHHPDTGSLSGSPPSLTPRSPSASSSPAPSITNLDAVDSLLARLVRPTDGSDDDFP